VLQLGDSLSFSDEQSSSLLVDLVPSSLKNEVEAASSSVPPLLRADAPRILNKKNIRQSLLNIESSLKALDAVAPSQPSAAGAVATSNPLGSPVAVSRLLGSQNIYV